MREIKRSCVSILREKFSQSVGLPFADILKESTIEAVLEAEGIKYRKRLFCPIVTIWAWLSQVLDADKSCKKAVSRVIAYLASAGKEKPSTNTSAYCKARARLKDSLLLTLVRKVGFHLHTSEDTNPVWFGRRVTIVDGSTLIMADTKPNQREYPQHKNQKTGCGFPIARIAALFSLSCGVVIDATISSLKVGEVNLFRQLFEHLKSGDVVLGDRAYGSYADICLLQSRSVDSLFRMHWYRKVDFRKGKRLGKYDHLVWWKKPSRCPRGLDQESFQSLPKQILLREIRFWIPKKGFRTKKVTLVTTLLDDKEYPKVALCDLYRLRWQAEIDLRHLKTRMTMEFLSSKTPQMVQNEFYVHLLAYNLIRTVQWEAGKQHSVLPISLSFAATIQHVIIFSSLMASCPDEQKQDLYILLKVLVATEKLLRRPNRVEPRAVKRRPKSYPRLKKPRNEYRRKCHCA